MERKVVMLKVLPEANPQKYVARPSYVAADKGDVVRFVNFTGAAVELLFEDGAMEPSSWTFDTPSTTPGTPPEVKEFSIVATASRRVKYFGKVAGSATVNLDGESSPEIIVDRVTTPMT